MIRFPALSIALPLFALALPLAATAAAAPQSRGAQVYFNAELAEPAREARPIAGGVVFHCQGTRCIAPRSGNRPLRVCRELQREVGPIASFSAGGEALSADRLEDCNR